MVLSDVARLHLLHFQKLVFCELTSGDIIIPQTGTVKDDCFALSMYKCRAMCMPGDHLAQLKETHHKTGSIYKFKERFFKCKKLFCITEDTISVTHMRKCHTEERSGVGRFHYLRLRIRSEIDSKEQTWTYELIKMLVKRS